MTIDKIPLTTLVRKYAELADMLASCKRGIARLEVQQTVIETEIGRRMDAGEMTKQTVAGYTITRREKAIWTVPPENWPTFYQYILDQAQTAPDPSTAFGLLHKRVATTRIDELIQNGEIIPGIVKFVTRATTIKPAT